MEGNETCPIKSPGRVPSREDVGDRDISAMHPVEDSRFTFGNKLEVKAWVAAVPLVDVHPRVVDHEIDVRRNTIQRSAEDREILFWLVGHDRAWVVVEGVNADIELRYPYIAANKRRRTAAAVSVEVENQYPPPSPDGIASGDDQPVDGAEALALAGSGVVEATAERTSHAKTDGVSARSYDTSGA